MTRTSEVEPARERESGLAGGGGVRELAERDKEKSLEGKEKDKEKRGSGAEVVGGYYFYN